MVRIKGFGILQTAKVIAALYFVVAVLFGVPLGLIILAVGVFSGDEGSLATGLLSIFVLPIVYGVLAFVGGVIACFLYNVIAKYTGGIEIELEHHE